MNVVEPIRDKRMIARIAEYLRRWNKRYFLIFEIGIYTGLRISDILALTYGDLIEEYRSGRRRWKEHLELNEIKTGRRRVIPLKDTTLGRLLVRELKPITRHDLDCPLFLTQRWCRRGARRPLTRWMIYYVLRIAAYECGFQGRVGTHTLRKTFGYHVYQQSHDVAQLQSLFGHSAQSITLRYIGVSQEDHDAAYRLLNFDANGNLASAPDFSPPEKRKRGCFRA